MNGEKNRLLWEMQKVKREIETHGEMHTFFREVLDLDGESTGETEEIKTIEGLAHISGTYVSRETTDATEVRTKRQPMLLCLWEDAKEIKNKDFVFINEQRFVVVNKRNVNECNIVCDFSLEVVLDGNN